jgi:hypothetical protein
MTRLHATVIALALCAAPQTANTAPSEFDRIVHAVEAQTGALRLHLVGMGFLLRASTWVARPAGASDFQTAIFYANDEQHGFSGAALKGALTHALDTSWHLTVRISSNGDAAQTLVWVRVLPDEKHTDLIVMSFGGVNNGVLTACRLSTKRFKEWLAGEEARTPAH